MVSASQQILSFSALGLSVLVGALDFMMGDH